MILSSHRLPSSPSCTLPSKKSKKLLEKKFFKGNPHTESLSNDVEFISNRLRRFRKLHVIPHCVQAYIGKYEGRQ